MPAPGTGELDSDPQLTNPGALDFTIHSGSPCVDAGDPAITDPDGTRSDMGALFVDQAGKALAKGF